MNKTIQVNNFKQRNLIIEPIIDFAEPAYTPPSLSTEEEHRFLK